MHFLSAQSPQIINELVLYLCPSAKMHMHITYIKCYVNQQLSLSHTPFSYTPDSNSIFISNCFSKMIFRISFSNGLCLSLLYAFSFCCIYEAKETTLQTKFLPVFAVDDTIGIFSKLLVTFFLALICSGLTIKNWNWFLNVVLGIYLIILDSYLAFSH